MKGRHVDWFPDRASAWEAATEYAATLVALGMHRTHGVTVKPSSGGYAVVVVPH